MESLNRLGHLNAAIDIMAQRLPVELFAIVDKTNQEVDLRHPSHIRNSQGANRRSFDLDQVDKTGQNRVLDDLLSTLYSKFEAIAEGHRAVHDVVVGIAKREGLGSGKHLSGGFKEMWKLYQSEVAIAIPLKSPPSDEIRSAPCYMIVWQQRVMCPHDLVGCRPQKPTSSRKLTEIKRRHVDIFYFLEIPLT